MSNNLAKAMKREYRIREINKPEVLGALWERCDEYEECTDCPMHPVLIRDCACPIARLDTIAQDHTSTVELLADKYFDPMIALLTNEPPAASNNDDAESLAPCNAPRITLKILDETIEFLDRLETIISKCAAQRCTRFGGVDYSDDDDSDFSRWVDDKGAGK
jgi:hypothetical protein